MFFMFFLLLLGMLTKGSHLLSFLIGVEFLGLTTFFIFSLYCLNFMGTGLALLFFIGALGCESALGLILFVLLTRFYSKDYLLGLNLMKF